MAASIVRGRWPPRRRAAWSICCRASGCRWSPRRRRLRSAIRRTSRRPRCRQRRRRRGPARLGRAAALAKPVQDALYQKIVPLLRGGAGAPALPRPRRRSRGATCASCRPGRARALGLTEVQVFSGGENVALKGKASQSSVAADGAIGGEAALAIDGGIGGRTAASTNARRAREWRCGACGARGSSGASGRGGSGGERAEVRGVHGR